MEYYSAIKKKTQNNAFATTWMTPETVVLSDIRQRMRIKSRISKAEEQISELKDKIVEITSEEQKKVKRMKKTKDSLRDLWTISNHKYLNYRGPRRRREKERL